MKMNQNQRLGQNNVYKYRTTKEHRAILRSQINQYKKVEEFKRL